MCTLPLLEHFTTAKLVTMTSQTPNGLRSVAANDVSSCAFVLKLFFPLFLSLLNLPVWVCKLLLLALTTIVFFVVPLLFYFVQHLRYTCHHYTLRKVFDKGSIWTAVTSMIVCSSVKSFLFPSSRCNRLVYLFFLNKWLTLPEKKWTQLECSRCQE